MKMFVVTDAKGQVIATTPIVSGRQSADAPAPGRPTALRGQRVHEVDVPRELQGMESAADLHRQLKKLIPSSRPAKAARAAAAKKRKF